MPTVELRFTALPAHVRTARLVATVARINERATGDDAGTAEAYAQCLLLQGMWAEAARALKDIAERKVMGKGVVKP